MKIFEAILAMLAAAVLLLALARRLRVPYPVLLALLGVALAFAPIDTGIAIDPTLVLALFVAPSLLDAAFDASLRDLKRHRIAVVSMALVAVGLTTAAVAFVVHAFVPALPWAAAIAIGAIVAPPDAVAATAVLRTLQLPHRLVVILEGEALLNDASTLLIYRLALTAVAAGGSIGAEAIAPAFLLSLVGSVIAGPALAWIIGRIVGRIEDVPSSIILQFVSTFGLWVASDAIGLSPILTVVTYAMTLAHSRATYQPARLRIPSYAVWGTAVVVLNVLAFLFIGLELGPVIARARAGELGTWSVIGAAVLATVIVVRLVWTIGAALWSGRTTAGEGGAAPPDWRSGMVVGWAGSRGIVTVATALALPATFPQHDLLLFIAFTTTLGTLLIQGATLRPLILALRLGGDDVVDGEVRHARSVTAEAALAAIADEDVPGIETLRRDLEAERETAGRASEGEGRPAFPLRVARARATAIRRERLQQLRAEGGIGDDAFHRLEEEFDLSDLATGEPG